jgi:asparagine synthase (glutamine-hydrolysing)
MFAFALWDSVSRKLLIGRDRIGEKPLYFHHAANRLFFASEFKALLSSGLIPFDLNELAVYRYMHYGYVPEPLSMVNGIDKLPAGSLMTVTLDPWEVRVEPYWDFEAELVTGREPERLIREQLEVSSRITARADVPIAISLSGGLDSSAVASLLREHYGHDIIAYSVGYPGRPPYDERDDARALADHLGIHFREVEIPVLELPEMFLNTVFCRDDPTCDIAGMGYYAVMRACHADGIKVLLQGHGGDELFWGYPWLREAAAKTLSKLAAMEKNPALQNQKQRLVFYDALDDFNVYMDSSKLILTDKYNCLFNSDDVTGLFDFWPPFIDADIRICMLAFRIWLLSNSIVQSERLSMANSVEIRLPLLDYRLVETVFGLRRTVKDHELEPKELLRRALAGKVPEWVMRRPKKYFAPPYAEWNAELKRHFASLLIDGFLVQNEIIKPEIALLVAQPESIQFLQYYWFHKLLTLEIWCRMYSMLPSTENVYRSFLRCEE